MFSDPRLSGHPPSQPQGLCTSGCQCCKSVMPVRCSYYHGNACRVFAISPVGSRGVALLGLARGDPSRPVTEPRWPAGPDCGSVSAPLLSILQCFLLFFLWVYLLLSVWWQLWVGVAGQRAVGSGESGTSLLGMARGCGFSECCWVCCLTSLCRLVSLKLVLAVKFLWPPLISPS